MTPYTSEELRPFLSSLSFQGPVEPFLVLADWLQERNDPWGNLIAVDTALEAKASEKLQTERDAILTKHGEAICPRWARVVYRRGFIAAAKLGDTNDLATLLSLPVATLLERLDLSESQLTDRQAKALIALKDRLDRAHVDLHGNLLTAATVEELRKALPHVDLSNQRVLPPPPQGSYFAESGSEHRAFIRLHGGPRSIEDIDD